ncbi:MAG: CotH kinase family protein [Lachnospiraceae bacterium]|nr:CotH kinase family protein [Lachnospiraceae bacterium]
MSTSKHFDKICCIVLCFTLVITLLLMNAESFGVLAAGKTMRYENRLFDTSRVHTIDIVMDDWDGFIETCTNEEYSVCSVIIDGEAYKNVGIRAKGNTSLSSVASYGNNRYSFKIEFDQYDSTKSYYGLDKLSLNNIIQDTTYMKDYLVYQMMGQFGVAAPLCSYAYITVNGEDFGLYLAVEAVEDGFLTRNYGSNYGDLYKPDSMSMGGGRGNGKDFDREAMEEMFEGFEDIEMPDMSQFDGMTFPNMGGIDIKAPDTATGGNSNNRTDKVAVNFGDKGSMGGFSSMGSSDVSLIYSDDNYDSYSNIFENAKTTVTDADKDRLIASLKQMNEATDIAEVVNIDEVIRYFVVHNFAVNFDSYTGSMIHNYYLYEEDGVMEMIPWDYNLAFGTFQGGSDATSLVNYPIDNPISGGDVSSRPMIAWIFENEEYTELYHQYFAEFLAMFYENGALEEMIDTVSEMIAPYVEKQPTEFYTYEEFQTGVATLKKFCSLRMECIEGQLNGTIPATSSGQSADSSALVDGSGVNVSDMGSFGGGGGFGGERNFGHFGDGSRDNGTISDAPTAKPSGDTQIPDMPQFGGETTSPDMGDMQEPENFRGGNMQTPEDFREGNIPWSDKFGGYSFTPGTSENSGDTSAFNRPSGNAPAGFDQNIMSEGISSGNSTATTLILLGISVLVLAGGLTFAILYGRKRY